MFRTYILAELADVLRGDLGESARYVHLAQRAVLRRTKRIALPKSIRKYVPGDPKDDPIVQTALTSKANYLVTADKVLLELRRVQSVEIITVKSFADRLPAPR